MTAVAALEEFRERVSTTNDYLTVNRIAKEHGYDPMALRSTRRFLEYVVGRRVVAKALLALDWSYPRIGRALGGRDHSTIWWLLHGGRGTKRRPPQPSPEPSHAR